MAVKIRLTQCSKKTFYRINVADSRAHDGRFIETVIPQPTSLKKTK